MLVTARESFAVHLRGTPTARDYVQRGLIAMWDAIENAGWGIHDATTRTWKDLVGSRDMSLTSYITIGDDAVTFASNYQSGTYANIPFNDVVCVEFVYRANVARVAYGVSFNSSGTYKYIAWRQQGKHIFMGNYGKNFLVDPTAARQSYHYDYSTTRLYVDGQERSSTGTGGTFSAEPAGVNTYGGAYSIDGAFSSLRVYSSALTAAEIAANYTIDKERFGL